MKTQLTEGQVRYRKYRKTYAKYRKATSEESARWRDKHLFGGNREKALERDNYSCIKCGMTDKEHRRKWDISITVDHIDGRGKNSKNKNNDLSNLQTLCMRCHGLKDWTRGTPFKALPSTSKKKILANLLVSNKGWSERNKLREEMKQMINEKREEGHFVDEANYVKELIIEFAHRRWITMQDDPRRDWNKEIDRGIEIFLKDYNAMPNHKFIKSKRSRGRPAKVHGQV